MGVINAPVSAPSFADLSGDGKPDVLLLNEGYNGEYFITTMLNDGTGRFSGPVASDTGINIVDNWIGDFRLGDFRNTGHIDFVGIGLGDSPTTQFILFAPGNGDGTFGKALFVPTTGAYGAISVGDFNHDGKLDFVAVGASSSGPGEVVTMFLGNGDGTFRSAGSAFGNPGSDVARVFTADFNRDGKLDVLAYGTGNAASVLEFLGNGDGTFLAGQQLFNSFPPMTLADANGDSWPDIISYNSAATATFATYLDQPSGSFVLSSSMAPYAGVPLQANPYLKLGIPLDPLTSSTVADLNGDGKPDEIAFQEVSPTNDDVYAQVLMGNGDGTFTPTYDVFDFQKADFFPGYTHNLDGTKFSDLLELDGATASMHVFKGTPAPAFQLALEEAQVSGTSGCGWVFLNVPSASDTNITLSTTVSGVNLPATVTIPAGSLNQQFCCTLGQTYDWHQVFDIRAQLGSDTAVAYASQSYVVGFSETISPSTDQVIYPTQSTTSITVTLTSSQGYSSTVHLSCDGLLAGETCTFGSSTLKVSPKSVASTTVVVNTSTTTEGSGPVVIVASDGNVTKRQSFNLTVQPLVVDAIGNPPQSTSPGTGTGEILIAGIPPYTPSCAGLPAGITCAFSGDQLPYPNDTNLTMTLTVPSGILAGAYPFTVTVVSGPAIASTAFTLNVTDFSLQPPNSGSAWAPPGGTVNVGLSVLPINNFNATVSVTCNLDVGGTCTGGSFPIGGTSPNPINVSVAVPSGASLGTHTLTVTATDAPLTHTIAFPFDIADYSGSLSTSTLTIRRNESGSLTATVNATAGFAGTVSFACTGTTQLTCNFSPSTVQPTPSSPQTTNVTVTASDSALQLPLKDSTKSRFLSLVLIFPFGLILAIAGEGRVRRAGIGMFVFALTLATLSCGGGSSGGGGGGGGGGGSNAYTITVTGIAAGTNTTRTLGTINVTVTH